MFVCGLGLLVASGVVLYTLLGEFGSLLLSYFLSERSLRLVVGSAKFEHDMVVHLLISTTISSI